MTKDSLSDEDLVKAYNGGSAEAFISLYHRFHERLYAFLGLRLGRRKAHLLDEIFQKTWLKVHLNRSSFDHSKKFSTWIFTIALNNLRDELGRASEKRPHDEITNDLVSEVPSVENLFHRAHLVSRVKDAIGELPEAQREAILLIDAEGMPSKEASAMMGVSDAAVRQLLFRARQALRKKFVVEDFR